MLNMATKFATCHIWVGKPLEVKYVSLPGATPRLALVLICRYSRVPRCQFQCSERVHLQFPKQGLHVLHIAAEERAAVGNTSGSSIHPSLHPSIHPSQATSGQKSKSKSKSWSLDRPCNMYSPQLASQPARRPDWAQSAPINPLI